MKIKMKDGSIQEAVFEEELGKNAFRHTTAHILAQAVKRRYPDTKCAIGPSIEDGFTMISTSPSIFQKKILLKLRRR